MADLTIDVDANLGNTSATIDDAANSLDDLGNAASSAGSDLDSVGDSANTAEGRISAVGAGALAASAGMSQMTDIVGQAVDLWNLGDRAADNLARAQNDVAQAALDLKQANQDGVQAQIDANQAQQDGVQSGIDLEQALLDQKVAQKDYNDAVKEFGEGSLEAQQAAIDLKQADADAKQAKLDGKQATEDFNQAQLDGKQSTIDAKNAQLDLNEAQRNVQSSSIMDGWFGIISQISTVVLGLVGTFALLGAGMLTTAATAVGSALTTAGAWIAGWVTMAATSTASAIAMAAAWLFSIWPIALIVAAVAGLVAVIIIYWDEIKEWTIKKWGEVWSWLQGFWTDFTSLVGDGIEAIKFIFFNFIPLGIIIKNWGAITGWVDKQWSSIASTVSGWVSKIGGFFDGMWDGVVDGLKWALNGIIGILNGGIYGVNVVIAGISSIPGVDISQIPYIPYLAHGGVTTGPTMAMIGEGAEQEAVLPLSKLQGMLNMAGNNGSSRVVIEFRGGNRAFREFMQESVRTTSGGSVTKYAGG